MRSGKFLVLFSASLFVAGVLTVCLSPFIIAGGLRLWAARVARQGGLQVELGRIEAPFLGPVVIHDLHITSDPAALFRVDAATPRLEIDLNLPAILRLSEDRMLRALRAEAITLDIRRNPRATVTSRLAWPVLEDLLADNFKLSGVQLHVENGSTVIDLHEGTLSGSELEAGNFTVREVAVASPWFHKSLSNLRGATSWQESRLVIGAISVMSGFDLDTVTIDLSRLSESRLAMEMSLDAFGGKIRVRVSSDDHGAKRSWDVAGNGSEISIGQMSDALEWTNRASGSLHASKFTFRGEVDDLRNATAAIWAEVTDLTWRDRTADTVMIGASLYNREVQIEQLYIKQRNNQVTLNGEFPLPDQSADWLKPAFRGDISASINDLGDFARLFGWGAADFAGKVAIHGTVSAREQKLAGQFSASGDSLRLFRSPVDVLEVRLSLEKSRLTVTQFEVRHKADFLLGEGNFELAGNQDYGASFHASVAEAAEYAGLMPRSFEAFALGGSVSIDWTGSRASAADSGTFHIRGQNLHPSDSSILPFDAEFQADYSANNIFFRQFHVWNPRVDLSAFVTVATDYVQLQTLRFGLNGLPKLQGNVFLPISAAKLRETSLWMSALSADPNFDLDLTLDVIDFAELASAVTAHPKISGNASGRIELYGSAASLAGKSELHLRDLVFENSSALSGDLETWLAQGLANLKATATTGGSDPVKLEGALPLQLTKADGGYVLQTEGSLSGSLDFPAIFLAKLPAYLSRGLFIHGILSGNLTISNSFQHPNLIGDVQLIDGQVLGGASFAAGLTFKGESAEIDFARLKQNGADVSVHGEIDLTNLSRPDLRFFPSTPLIESASLEPGDCVNRIEFLAASGRTLPSLPVHQLDFRGSFFAPDWTISLFHEPPNETTEIRSDQRAPRTFPFCDGSEPRGKTLTLQVAEPFFP